MNGDEEKYSPFTPTLSKAPFTRSRKPAAGVVSSRYEEYSGGCGTMVFAANVVASCGSLSRAGRSLGRRRPASVPRRLRPKLIATIFLQSVRPGQLRPESQPYFVILNEVKNLFPCEPKAADGLCLARRRKTNEVQSNICIVSIQILRRSAPQNDKLLNCSQTPQQTGICNWRQRE